MLFNRVVAPGQMRRQAQMRRQVVTGPEVDKGLGILEWTGSLVPQGLLVKGAKNGWKLAWKTMMKELAPQTADGSYSRPSYDFQARIGDANFPVESGRYHIYVGNACPWCHRVVLALIVRGLTEHISVTWAADDPERASRGGWVFNSPEPVFGKNDLREVYDAAQTRYKGRCTAPLLIDKKQQKLVSNESSDIMRMLNSVSLPGCNDIDLYPSHLQSEIDEVNDLVYDKINNGVYKSGFSTSQEALTEADLRLYPTIIRFDSAYAILFKCSKHRVSDYPNLKAWLRDMYQLKVPSSGLQVKDSVDVADACRSYFQQLFPLNPGGIVPAGPTLDDLKLSEAHGRGSPEMGAVFHEHKAPSATPAMAV
ncbi:MAG: hypothetical protein FRX49_06426 [Trebouxia sp. A1-2]|nr:MAG: hypothetical protein FRX49_06426 [Trebouxia sp. A1-2]